VIEVRVYPDDGGGVQEARLADVRDLLGREDAFVWLDAVDPSEEELATVGAAFDLHALTLEDVRHRRQRPRVELFDRYAFVAIRPLSLGGDDELDEHEVHAVVGRRSLVTLRYGPLPAPVDVARRRWEGQRDTLASAGGGFAVYLLLDEIVDGYLSIIEELEDRTDAVEDDVFAADPGENGGELQERIFRLKREVVRVRRVVAPLRQGLDFLQEDPRLVGQVLQPYYRDLTEHVIRVSELADNIRDLLTSLLEVRVAQVANRLNEIMKKLSAWAGIILVPTLIAGIYGMNFRHMPELGMRVGYPGALALMGVSALVLYVGFKRRGWL
jgi:magnesium transporter